MIITRSASTKYIAMSKDINVKGLGDYDADDDDDDDD